MNILVTGGAGFIGSNLVDKLISLNHKVTVIDNLSRGSLKNINKKAKFIKLDIKDSLEKAFSKNQFNVIFHTAAHIDARESVKDPYFNAEQNIMGTLNLLKNCKKFGVKKIIFSSSGGAIYCDKVKLPTKENDLEQPISPYGISKIAIEKYLIYYKALFNIDFVSLRYSNVYGPRQDLQGKGYTGVVSIFINNLLKNKKCFINGTGKQTRDYVFVKDVVDANIKAMKKKVNGIFNIATSKETSVNELYKLLAKLIKSDLKPEYKSAPEGEQIRSCLSYEKAKRLLNWAPKIGISEGLKETISYFKKA